MNIKKMREKTGLSQSKFAALFKIPIKTLQAWEQERSNPPEYVVVMMERLLTIMSTDINKE